MIREGAQRIVGEAARGQRGFLYDIATLPAAIRDALPPQYGCEAPSDASGDSSLNRYDEVKHPQKQEADRRYLMMKKLKQLLESGKPGAARTEVATAFECSTSTVKLAWKIVCNAPEDQWKNLLVKNYKGQEPMPIRQEIVDFFRADYGHVSKPKAEGSRRRTVLAAKLHDWGPVPCTKTLLRRCWGTVPYRVRVDMREGPKAHDDTIPHAERDRTGKKPMWMLNLDGRRLDLLAIYPDGEEVARPMVIPCQDVATNFILGAVYRKTESGEGYRSILRKVMGKNGVPENVLIDNGRGANAKQLTGGAPGNRFTKRRKTAGPSKEKKEKEKAVLAATGVLLRAGIKVVNALPYNGRSKWIERALGDLVEQVEKHPLLRSAYIGRSPSQKPDHRPIPMPIAFVEKVFKETIEEYNHRPNRRSTVAWGKSYYEAFEEGLKSTQVPTRSQRELDHLFLDYDLRKVTRSGSFTLGKGRYTRRHGSDNLLEYAGQTIAVRSDPEDFTAPVVAETIDGRVIDNAVPLLTKDLCDSQAQATEHARVKNRVRKNTKAIEKDLFKQMAIERGEYQVSAAQVSDAPVAPVIAPNFTAKVPRVRDDNRFNEARDKGMDVIEHLSRYG